MTKYMVRAGMLGLLAAAIVGTPVHLKAQEKENTPATAAAPKAPRVMPFRGKLKAVDPTAKTIEVGTRKFQVTADTKVSKGDKPAKLTDGVAGEQVSGAYRSSEDGKLIATMVHFGPKPQPTTPKKEPANNAEAPQSDK